MSSTQSTGQSTGGSSGKRSSTGGSSGSSSSSSAAAAFTPRQLLKKFPLPVAAHLHAPTQPPGLDLSRPLLLYNNYTSTKVRAVSLTPSQNGILAPVGPAIVIPDAYTGWFALVSPTGQTATSYQTVAQVAESQTAFFLTRYDVPAYTKVEEGAGKTTYQRINIGGGNVLKLMGIFENHASKKTSITRKITGASSEKYAQCLNYKNEILFLPFNTPGRFYSTATKSSHNFNNVYLMTRILKIHKLPITVKLVCGFMPKVPVSFTGLLSLEEAKTESVILASTMTSGPQSTLMEIDVSSNFVLSPMTDPVFSKTPIFLKTVSYCKDEGEAWRRQIKVTHHVTENCSRPVTQALSTQLMEPQIVSRSRQLNLDIINDNERRKVRSRDKSRDKLNLDIISDIERRKVRSRDKSCDKLLEKKEKIRTRDKSVDNFQYKSGDKLNEKGKESRKVTKQNTYIFQNGRTTKVPEKKMEKIEKRMSKSIENLDYSRVADDITPVQEHTEEEESQYAEICDEIDIVQTENGKWRMEAKTGESSNPLTRDYESFTLLKKDIGRYYNKIQGFEAHKGESEPNSIDRKNGNDSLC